MEQWSDLFTNRQATALCVFSDLVKEARAEIASRSSVLHNNSQYANIYADAVTLYLSLLVGKLTNRSHMMLDVTLAV